MSEIYETPILITEAYLKAYSPIPLNYNWKDIKPFITIAENIYIVPILGKQLYDELIDQVTDNTVTDVNSTLLLKLYPLEALTVVIESLPFQWANITEKGITLGKSDNSDSIDRKDLTELMNHLKSEVDVLTRGVKKFLEDNKECFPLYVSENCGCKIPEKKSYLYNSNNRRKCRNY